jgi:hypothetical protein
MGQPRSSRARPTRPTTSSSAAPVTRPLTPGDRCAKKLGLSRQPTQRSGRASLRSSPRRPSPVSDRRSGPHGIVDIGMAADTHAKQKTSHDGWLIRARRGDSNPTGASRDDQPSRDPAVTTQACAEPVSGFVLADPFHHRPARQPRGSRIRREHALKTDFKFAAQRGWAGSESGRRHGRW